MPSAGRPRQAALDHVTRQQLDELDALMQRMLALPVNPTEDLAGPPLQQPQGTIALESTKNVPAPPTEPANSVMAEPEKREGILPAVECRAGPFLPPPADHAQASVSEVALAPRELGARTQPRSPPSVTPSPPHPLTPSPPPVVKAKAEARPPRLAWPQRPLLWVNVAFDCATAWLGPVGHWLRAPSGRALLGWTGLLLLAAAVAWLLLDGMGWTW